MTPEIEKHYKEFFDRMWDGTTGSPTPRQAFQAAWELATQSSEDDERDAETARKAKGYKDSENFHDPYLSGAIVERKKSDAFRDGFTTGRQGLKQAVKAERERIYEWFKCNRSTILYAEFGDGEEVTRAILNPTESQDRGANNE